MTELTHTKILSAQKMLYGLERDTDSLFESSYRFGNWSCWRIWLPRCDRLQQPGSRTLRIRDQNGPCGQSSTADRMVRLTTTWLRK
jgi:hypothetical protein